MKENKPYGDTFFVSPEEVEKIMLPWGELRFLSEPKTTGADYMPTALVTVYPGQGGHSAHIHPEAAELIYVLDGLGEQVIWTNGQDDKSAVKRTLKKGDLVHIPAGLYHSAINIGEEPYTAILIYQFSGPEADFRNDPEAKIIPPAI